MDYYRYDRLMLSCIGKDHIKKRTVYYDEEYLAALKSCLERDHLLEAYENELQEVTKNDRYHHIKMCSIASSSRLCYLASKTILSEIDEHEKTDVTNGICEPHYDAFNRKSFTFYEFKCHEFCWETHDELVNSYRPLLKEIFGMNVKDTTRLRFSDFHIDVPGDPLIHEARFDFKQLLCHVIGLLSIATKEHKPTLQYVWIVPDVPQDEELQKFIKDMKAQIERIFTQFGNVPVSTSKEQGLLNDFITFGLCIIPVTMIPDFVLKGI